jgi:hypothetical protein
MFTSSPFPPRDYKIAKIWGGKLTDSSYRVNLFGYPNAKGLTDLNPGLLDQRKALVNFEGQLHTFLANAPLESNGQETILLPLEATLNALLSGDNPQGQPAWACTDTPIPLILSSPVSSVIPALPTSSAVQILLRPTSLSSPALLAAAV